uniref:RxLR effector protein n=1 Tax=Chromera velia CCMP2878 TaxID=1169474 RepID=A0A0G4HJ52_9ALVE|eukprot:Cvel_7041.t1-p1 / transcript=Cvel_7041.t1 / gene=Cvel_7041 / organism=Chromera_velia_CCMP2878 / gene_product=hypothetical protein / transcript_product=hypothetical protein / location=Cvel_scaffold359:67581-68672(+) / protein_length=243 / sequence_SO=supercontig / SO=protein_coding / is_pseudo=false
MSLKFLAAHLLGLFVQVGSSVSVSVSGRHFLPLSQQQQKLQQPHHRDPPGGTEGGAEGGGAGTERGEAEAFTASPKKVSSGCPPPFPEGASQQQLSHLQVPPGTPPFSFPPASAASASASSAAAVVVSHHPPNAPPSRCSSADRGDLSGISTRQVSGGNQQTSSSVLTSQPQSLGAQGPSQTSSLGGHDSVEDARAALALYKHYLKLQAEGRVESTIRQLYDIGYKTNWKVPWQMQQPDLVGS